MKLAKELIPRVGFVAEYAAVEDNKPKSSPPAGRQISAQDLWLENEKFIQYLIRRLLFLRPRQTDADYFRRAVFSRAYEKFLANALKFRGTNWDGFLYRMMRNVALDEVREIIGDQDGLDVLDEMMDDSQRLPRPDHMRIVDELMTKYASQGAQAKKCADAIRLRHYDGCTAKEIAVRIGATPQYVDQLFSHDYPELRAMARAKYNISGRDL